MRKQVDETEPGRMGREEGMEVGRSVGKQNWSDGSEDNRVKKSAAVIAVMEARRGAALLNTSND